MQLTQMALWFITTPGPGGVVVISIVTIAALVYFFLVRWIIRGGE
ncbi:MAG: hypothetical protein WCP19_15260 [Chloroflexota bacterium]